MPEAIAVPPSVRMSDDELALFLLTVASCLRQEAGAPAKVYRVKGGDPGFVKRLVLAHDDRPGLLTAVCEWLEKAEPEAIPDVIAGMRADC